MASQPELEIEGTIYKKIGNELEELGGLLQNKKPEKDWKKEGLEWMQKINFKNMNKITILLRTRSSKSTRKVVDFMPLIPNICNNESCVI